MALATLSSALARLLALLRLVVSRLRLASRRLRLSCWMTVLSASSSTSLSYWVWASSTLVCAWSSDIELDRLVSL
ncbi:MAG: hypothetical protein U0667_18370 [Chloroflexota bacterium]